MIETVGELRAALKEFPQDYPIEFNYVGDDYRKVSTIREYKDRVIVFKEMTPKEALKSEVERQSEIKRDHELFEKKKNESWKAYNKKVKC